MPRMAVIPNATSRTSSTVTPLFPVTTELD
jgi:hypothetical protein